MSQWQTLFDARLDVSPPVGEASLAQIPAKRGVVLLTAEKDEPIVLLTAADLRSRTRNRLSEPREESESPAGRRRSPDLRQITRAILFTRCESHFETDWRFLELARAVWPERFTRLVAWKPAWFVHVDPAGRWPHFSRTREVFSADGRYFGPMASGIDAQQFIEALQDAFDLCRNLTCLRRSPNGPRCAYAEMGRCVSPADGSISMDAYRRLVAQAADFAAGDRQALRDRLTQQMAQAARELKFEQAAAIKSRLSRLEVFDRECYRHVAPADAFAFILIHPGRGAREARAFCAVRGVVEYAGELAIPLKETKLAGVLETMRRLAGDAAPCDAAGRLRMGLVARTLFSGPQRRGVVLPWRDGLTVQDIAGVIEAGRETLRLGRAAASTGVSDETSSDSTAPASV
jgi:excinuclease UvrABC nuclease subunit